MKTINKILFFLSPSEKKNFFLLIIFLIIAALIETLGILSIMPFISVISNPDVIEENNYLKNLFQFSDIIGVESVEEFVFVLGVLTFFFLIFTIGIRAFSIFFQQRFVLMREHSIANFLFNSFIRQKYSWFLSRNSSDIIKSVLSETGVITSQVLSPILNLLTNIFLTLAIILLLLIVDVKVTIIIFLILIISYLLIYNSFKKYLKRIGEERFNSNIQRFRLVNEALSAIKDVKIRDLEDSYLDQFSKQAKIFSEKTVNSNFVSLLPRYLLEAVMFGGVILLILYLIDVRGSLSNILPILAVFIFSGYRLIPSAQQIYQSISILKFSQISIDKIYNDVKNLEKVHKIKPSEYKNKFLIKKEIKLKNISFNYPNTPRVALKDLSISIPAFSSVGIMGPTGCGKTTVMDIIIGLLQPQSGTLEVDNEVINSSNLARWQSSIGYVPQNIYLSDNTLEANIAFGVNEKDIDDEAVINASKIANLHKFVNDELPNKYKTMIGERGIKLSGGQRQRIGIARAFYHQPKVLILDEATSALDQLTEQNVMNDIYNLDKDITVIIVTHRLITLQKCDIIFRLDKGKLIEQASPDKILKL